MRIAKTSICNSQETRAIGKQKQKDIFCKAKPMLLEGKRASFEWQKLCFYDPNDGI